jgi:hypothetical protein
VEVSEQGNWWSRGGREEEEGKQQKEADERAAKIERGACSTGRLSSSCRAEAGKKNKKHFFFFPFSG